MTFVRSNWGLAARALVFALSWLYLPFWIFVLLAFYCYFVPAFHAGRLFAPFSALLVLCYVEPAGILMAIIFGAIFYYLLLKKNLLLIDRATAHELLTMILSFFLFREFYLNLDQGPTGAALVWVFLAALLWSVLLNNLIAGKFGNSPAFDATAAPNIGEFRLLRRASVLFSFILMTQCLFIVLFLPLNFIYQSTIVFLVAALLIELLPEYVAGILSGAKIRLTGTVIFTLLVVVLAAARWWT
jgi:hypothetical protein